MAKKVVRPWGYFEILCPNKKCTIKVHSIKANQAMSLQSHKKRDELWIALTNGVGVVLGKKRKILKKGQRIFIKRGKKHRAFAGKKTVKLLEVTFGEFDENDIVRYEDKYGRN